MAVDLSRLSPQPAGFDQCPNCAHVVGGSADVCFACANLTLEPVPDPRCKTCSGPGGAAWDPCENPVCGFGDRYYNRVWAVAMLAGPMARVVKKYKYGGKQTAWSTILARLLLGYMEEKRRLFERFDVIAATPAFVGEGAARKWDHVGGIVEQMAIEDTSGWPFDPRNPPLIIQTRATPKFVDQPSWQARRLLAEGKFAESLLVPRPQRVSDKRILIIEDVYTDGLRLREVARVLKENGAAEVSELVCGRAVFRGHAS